MRVSPACFTGIVSNVLKAELWGPDWLIILGFRAGRKGAGPAFIASVTIIEVLGQEKKLIIQNRDMIRSFCFSFIWVNFLICFPN